MNYPSPFGKYLLLERINIGGMAEVFKAKTYGVQGFERFLAIKRILPNMAEDDEFINMFVDEARIAVQLTHANVVQIYELGKFENQFYIAMEYVSGRDMRQVLDKLRKETTTVPVPTTAFVISKICEGLDYAHRRTDPSGRPLNLIHRDVSPQNILVGYEGDVKITDFGIAKAEDRASKTQAGVLKGKFAYMSPEQVRGLPIDRRSDIFAVGILMYEMLTGERLFVGESDFTTLEKVRNAEVPPPRMHNPDIPEELEAIVLKTLSRDRDERYQWASELHDDLQQFLIVNNSIYNGKRLAEYLSGHYAEEIERERSRMEEFAAIAAPAGLNFESPAKAGAEPVAAAPVPASTPWVGTEDEDKTMIFAGFDFQDPQTATGVGAGVTGVVQDELGKTGEVPALVDAGAGVFAPAEDVPTGVLKPPASRKSRGPLVVLGASVLLCASILAMVFSGSSNSDLGSIRVISSPVTDVEVWLDGDSIGQGSPLLYEGLKAGVMYKLRVKAKGYADKAYLFEAPAGGPFDIPIELDPLPEQAPVLLGTLQVVSEPPGAKVRLNNEERGETPITIKELDRSVPLVLQLEKEGYGPERRTERFDDGQELRVVSFILKEDTEARASGSVATVRVVTDPPGAIVWLDGLKKGVSPLTLEGVSRSEPHRLEAYLKGYRKQSERIDLKGKTSFDWKIELDEIVQNEKIANAPVVSKPKSQPRRSDRGCGGSGGKLSVMPVGVADCTVTVGGVSLGVAPFFKKAAPKGSCEVVVSCPDGRKKKVTNRLGGGGDTRVIIKPGDW